MNEKIAVAIFARVPELGKVKTRLAPILGEDGALAFYEESLESVIKKCQKSNVIEPFLYCAGSLDHPKLISFHNQFDVPIFSQEEGDLGQRMVSALGELHQTFGKAVVIGSDSPTLPISYVEQAIEKLDTHDVVLGPSFDGGYYLLGSKKGVSFDLLSVQWSVRTTFDQTVQSIQEQGHSVEFLPPWYDVDDEDGYRIFKIERSL